MITCIWQKNFLNCPQSSIAPSEKCEATKKFIKEQDTCGTKYEDIFVVDDFIFGQSRIQINKCQETFKGAELNSSKCVHVPEVAPPSKVYDGCVDQCRKNECCMTPCILNSTSSEDFGEKAVKN